MTPGRSSILSGIPLYLVPQAVARLIRLKGEATHRISVVRTRWHHYNVRVRTNTCRKELRPACSVVPGKGPDHPPCGSLPAASARSRGCAA